MLPLEGISILDFSHLQAGPICTQMLADFGATVLKVERPGTGDIQRSFTVRLQGIGHNFLALNRNKRSLAIDLKYPEAKEIIRKLIARCDVLVENFRPGVMDRLGLGYEDVKAINPSIIYASATAYGSTGQYSTRKGQDIFGQALGGMATMNGARDDPPTLVGIPIADFAAGMILCEGILMALIHRQRTGEGQRLETNLVSGILYTQLQDLLAYLNTGEVPVRAPRGGSRPLSGPTVGVYRASDGYCVVNMALSPGNPVSGMCAILGIPDLAADPRFNCPAKIQENYVALRDIFAEAISKRTVAEWVEAFEKADAMCAPVHDYAGVCQDPQVLHNGMIVEMDHPRGGRIKALGNPLTMYGTPWQMRLCPPELGAHTDEILQGLGYEPEQIAALRDRKIVGGEQVHAPETDFGGI